MARYLFNERTGRYYDTANGRFVSRAQILEHLATIQNNHRIVNEQLARQYLAGDITLRQFQTRFLEEFRNHSATSMYLATGGVNAGDTKQLVTASDLMESHIKVYWKDFVKDIQAGNLSDERLVWRAKLYATFNKEMFYTFEHERYKSQGYKQAKRDLDAAALHCNQCPEHSTNGLYINIEDVVLPGQRCDCGNNCRCRVTYKR